jgi:outer membrane receptor protein involved in Fe transport
METIKALPSFMGEVDVMKSLVLLPGISAGGEGSTGIFVRGGNVDQNLVLLDEATVYNASHLMGFFSVFNADAIKDVQVYKGGIPAQYGGRLSSVVDMRMKDGNSKKFSATGGFGSIASRLTVEGPIQRDVSSFIVSGRRTYFDMFLPFSADTQPAQQPPVFL